MKKLLILIVVLAVAWIGVNYMRTGQISLLPAALSDEERELRELRHELAAIESQVASAGRSAGITGMDMTADVEGLLKKKEQIEEKIAKARKKLR